MNPIKNLPLVATLFLFGCQTTQWVNYGDPSANLDRDQYECKRDAYGMVRTPNAVAAPAPTIPSTYSTNCNMLGNSAYCSTQQTNGMAQAMIAQSNQQMAQSYAELGAAISRANIMDECMRAKGWRKEAVEPTATASSRSASGSAETKFVPDFGSKGYSRPSPTERTSNRLVALENKPSSDSFDWTSEIQIERRDTPALLNDLHIEASLKAFLQNKNQLRPTVQFHSFNRRVLLAGEFEDATVKNEFVLFASKIIGVKLVIDELKLSSNPVPQDGKMDRVIEIRVKNFLKVQGVAPGIVRVFVNRGTAFLMGIIGSGEEATVVDVASRTPGVQKVVAALEIISTRELADLEKSIPNLRMTSDYFRAQSGIESSTKLRCKIKIRKSFVSGSSNTTNVDVDTVVQIDQKGLIFTLKPISNQVGGVVNTTLWMPDGLQLTAVDLSTSDIFNVRNRLEDQTQTTTHWQIDRNTGNVTYTQEFSDAKGTIFDSGDGHCEKVDASVRKF